MRLRLVLSAALIALAPLATPSFAADAPPVAAVAADITGDWEGQLVTPSQNLPQVLHLQPGSTPAASLQSPGQSLAFVPGALTNDSSGVKVVVPALQLQLSLTLSADGQTLSGALTQGQTFPISFKRRAAGAAPAVLNAGETAVQIPGPLAPIKGSLALTEGPPKAAAVLIQGSGPTDRDGDDPQGLAAAPQRYLAAALAAKGIESIRYDKRGMFASMASVSDGNDVTVEDYAQDARDFAALAAQRAGQPCAWLIGHSEGALVALQAAQKPDKICGVVLLASPGRKLGAIIRQQLNDQIAALPAAQQAAARAQIYAPANAALTKLEAGRKVDTTGMPDNLLSIFRPQVQGFLIDELRYDPAALVAAYNGPVLVVSGTNDVQVAPADADRLTAARPGVKRVDIPGMNHVLKTAPADRTGNLATYANPNLTLAPGLADAVTSFILSPPSAP